MSENGRQAHEVTVLHSADAEDGVLASIMLEPIALDAIGDMLSPEHFFRSHAAELYRAMFVCYSRGQMPDPITLSDVLATSPMGQIALEAYGGRNRLTRVDGRLPGPA